MNAERTCTRRVRNAHRIGPYPTRPDPTLISSHLLLLPTDIRAARREGDSMTTTATCGGCDATWTGHRIEHCPVCHETFSGSTAGDRHRVGTFEPMDRRCLTGAEMVAIGMRRNARGVWTSGGGYWGAA